MQAIIHECGIPLIFFSSNFQIFVTLDLEVELKLFEDLDFGVFAAQYHTLYPLLSLSPFRSQLQASAGPVQPIRLSRLVWARTHPFHISTLAFPDITAQGRSSLSSFDRIEYRYKYKASFQVSLTIYLSTWKIKILLTLTLTPNPNAHPNPNPNPCPHPHPYPHPNPHPNPNPNPNPNPHPNPNPNPSFPAQSMPQQGGTAKSLKLS